MNSITPKTKLRRRLTLPLVVLYGLGVTIGAGIYVLIGAAASRADMHAPIAFVIAAIVMGFSAASFAEFVSRLPVSAGAAAYVQEGFRRRGLALATGIAIALSGIVSSAAISLGSAGYLGELLDPLIAVDQRLLTVFVIVVVAAIACVGILESVTFAAVMTLIEIGGLLAVIVGGAVSSPDLLTRLPEVIPTEIDPAIVSGIVSAGLLAFFAFIGFEDMVHVAEEVKDPTRTMPRAIVLTLAVSTLLYFLVASIAVLAVPVTELEASEAPLALVFAAVTSLSPDLIAMIAVIATVNGIIIQVIMASRVLYGMADQGTISGFLGRWLSQVSTRTGTPVVATGLVAAAIVVLALSLDIERLASMTSRIVLGVFVLVNLALVRVKLRERSGTVAVTGPAVLRVPLAVPAIGAALSAGLLLFGN
jgi:basic amino acid/polyamine antiporter, APA family